MTTDPRTWVLSMRWAHLAFLHWPVEPRLVQQHLPPGLRVDTFDGQAWLGVVPFRMQDVRPRAVPFARAFPELNLRTYVRSSVPSGDAQGVWFFSLDATDPLFVRVARSVLHLPYRDARISLRQDGPSQDGPGQYGQWHMRSERHDARFDGLWRPTGSPFEAQPGTLEHFLTERYAVYAADRHGRIARGEVAHAPWPLQPGEAQLRECTLGAPFGLPLDGPPLVHVTEGVDVRAFAFRRLRPEPDTGRAGTGRA